MALALVALFALMPLPNALNAMASDMDAVPTVSYSSVARAGVVINGVTKTAINPISIGGVYYVPFKNMAQILDYDAISYNAKTKTYSATDGSVTVRVTIGGTHAMKGDERINIHAPRFVNGTTYLSLDAVSSVFNTFTYFNAPDGSVRVQMPATTYKVHSGDSLFKIAQAHHTTATAVRAANGLRSDVLMPGQILQLPVESLKKEMETGSSDVSVVDPNTVQGPAATPTASQSATAARKAQAIITLGKKYMGVPYKFGAKTSDAPRLMDCSSFMQYIFGKNGISLPRDSRQQSNVGTRVSRSQLQPGDLMFFKYPERYSDGRVGHVGVYMGNGQILHTIPKPGVTITKFGTSGYWSKNFLYGKRVIK
ncbi:C40 family peptidase [Tumebacillus sp. ITR2]|uniref:C40 family peptidase n=2 Tax=Tumebacillus amylolyticus TaxID=2801339 RepID=A0ABS1JGY4_9BACL|nr:C40 family peptidase [Tumebacillus amylolyticus]